jgi:mercuric reductase
VRITGVERVQRGYRVAIEQGSIKGALDAEQLLVATGRRANTEELGLDAAGVRTDQRGFVEVDEFMRTSNADVFAAGDVTGGPAYVYVAALQGSIAAQAALAELTGEAAVPIDLGTVPRVTFTDPQVAAVGMTDAEARDAGVTAEVTSLPVRHLPRAAVSYRQQGIIKLVSEAGTDRLLGAHVVAANAGDVIGEATLAVRFGLSTRDLVSTLHPYLTWGEGLKLAAQTFTKDVAKLSCCA